jgi:hypothetical protein
MRTRWIIVAVALTGCAGKLEEVVRLQAAKDLNCPVGEVDVVDQRSDNYVRDYSVSGCGQTAHYQAACSMVESCVAYQPAKIGKDAAASEALTAGIDAVPGSESVEEVVIAADGTMTVNRSGPAAAPPPAKTPLELAQEAEAAQANEPLLSVTLRNTCSETVTLWFGPTPGSGVGHMMTLASTNMATVRVRPGEQLWVLDREHNGTAGVAVDASMREVDVGCAGLTAR